MSKAILVTGGRGFLGRRVARAFRQQGYRVVGLGHGDCVGPGHGDRVGPGHGVDVGPGHGSDGQPEGGVEQAGTGTGSPGSHAATAANVRTAPASTARSRDLARITFLPREDCAARLPGSGMRLLAP